MAPWRHSPRGAPWILLVVALLAYHATADPSDRGPGDASTHKQGTQSELNRWAQGLGKAFTKERVNMLWEDLKQFLSLFNIMVLGPYHRALYSSWTKFTWRLARYINLTARTVAAVREHAKRSHSYVLTWVISSVKRLPAPAQSVLRSNQLVELLLLYSYSAVLALAVASVIHACSMCRRSRRSVLQQQQQQGFR